MSKILKRVILHRDPDPPTHRVIRRNDYDPALEAEEREREERRRASDRIRGERLMKRFERN
jgi:hypothetical protein